MFQNNFRKPFPWFILKLSFFCGFLISVTIDVVDIVDLTNWDSDVEEACEGVDLSFLTIKD